jgi:hypothetical protein
LVTHNPDPSFSLQEQIQMLAQFVNDNARTVAEHGGLIADLQGKLRELEAGTATLERNLLERIEIRLDEFDDRLNTKQVLDLRWAIAGLAISFVGTVLSLGT